MSRAEDEGKIDMIGVEKSSEIGINGVDAVAGTPVT